MDSKIQLKHFWVFTQETPSQRITEILAHWCLLQHCSQYKCHVTNLEMWQHKNGLVYTAINSVCVPFAHISLALVIS